MSQKSSCRRYPSQKHNSWQPLIRCWGRDTSVKTLCCWSLLCFQQFFWSLLEPPHLGGPEILVSRVSHTMECMCNSRFSVRTTCTQCVQSIQLKQPVNLCTVSYRSNLCNLSNQCNICHVRNAPKRYIYIYLYSRDSCHLPNLCNLFNLLCSESMQSMKIIIEPFCASHAI